MAEIVALPEAVAALVSDGDSIALEDFTHLIPLAAGHELLRQGRTELVLIRMTPDILYDQMIGVGVARKLVSPTPATQGSGHCTGSATSSNTAGGTRSRSWSTLMPGSRTATPPVPRACHAGGYVGTDLEHHTRVERVICPFTGQELVAVPTLNPEVAIVHPQEADCHGNVQL